MAKDVCVIFTNVRDIHACAVDQVLNALGQRTAMLNTAALPSGQSISIEYGSEIAIRIGEAHFSITEVKSSWNRRFSRLFQMPDNIHEADIHHIRDNSIATLTGMAELLNEKFSVNPLCSGRIKSNKLIQLKIAGRVGFKVPRTIISNSHKDIMTFLTDVGDACVKSYNAYGWQADDAIYQAMTTKISNRTDLNPASFEIVPHIYQQLIEKVAEYRLVMFGKYCACVKIDSKSLSGNSQIDWRSDPTYLSYLSIVKLPARVLAAAHSMMKALKLRFAIFDLAETKDGEFVFFEINESGQWLWQELHCPESPILQPFANFLASANDEFEWDQSQSSDELSAKAICSHVENNPKYAEILMSEFPDKSSFVNDERQRERQNEPPSISSVVAKV